jgi:hypothetical protein
MAIVQISQIQVRRGLQQDLAATTLTGGEMGWSLDQRRLFIGNGTTAEGAPEIGHTEILTEHSDFLGFVSSYTFAGTDAGYTSQTGATILAPVTRSLQSVLDDSVSVRDFGTVANGTTDDTAALNRAIQQIYVSSLNGTYRNVQRTIKIPAGTYKISSPLLIPPNCTLVGDGKNNTYISATAGTAFSFCDSLFQLSTNMGTNGATLPSGISIRDLSVATASITAPTVLINKSTDVTFNDVKFIGGNYGLSLTGATSDIKLNNSSFSGYATKSMYIDPAVTGIITRARYFDTTNVSISSNSVASIGNVFTAGAGVFKYQMNNASSTVYRIGELKYNSMGTVGNVKFDDEFVEPTAYGSSLTANLFAHANGNVICSTTTPVTIKYNHTQFI